MATANRRPSEVANITRYVLILLGFIVIILLLYSIRNLVAIVYISLIVGATLHPVAVYLQKWLPRAVALTVIYLSLLGISILLGFLIVPPLVIQFGGLLAAIPEQAEAVAAILASVDDWLRRAGVPLNLEGMAAQISSQFGGLAVRLVQIPVLIVDIFASLFAILALSFYWLLDRDRLLASLFYLFPSGQRQRAMLIYLRSEERLGAFVRGLFVASTILGVTTYLGLLILGVPFPLLLAIIAAMFEVIPIIGPYISGVPIVGIALLQSPAIGLATLLFWVGIQLLEGNVLTPLVQRSTVRLAPFAIVLALLVGAALLGIVGALLAIPTAVLISILLYELSPDHVHRDDEVPP